MSHFSGVRSVCPKHNRTALKSPACAQAPRPREGSEVWVVASGPQAGGELQEEAMGCASLCTVCLRHLPAPLCVPSTGLQAPCAFLGSPLPMGHSHPACPQFISSSSMMIKSQIPSLQAPQLRGEDRRKLLRPVHTITLPICGSRFRGGTGCDR